MKGTAVILGAGASKAALIEDSKYTPPLDIDFFRLAATVLGKSHHALWQTFLKKLTNAGFKERVTSYRLEELSTQLEARVNLKWLKADQGAPPKYADLLDDLYKIVSLVMIKTGGTLSCRLHERLLSDQDLSAVVSFNYDLLADRSLYESGRLAWSNSAYVGPKHHLSPPHKATYYVISEDRRCRSGRIRLATPVPLYKLHGSINWKKLAGGRILCHFQSNPLSRTENSPFGLTEAIDRPGIVPPFASKANIENKHFQSIWIAAKKALAKADIWIIWGYSMPWTDTNAILLFRTALTGVEKNLIIINPDTSLKSHFARKLGVSETKIAQYQSAERYLIDNKSIFSSGNFEFLR